MSENGEIYTAGKNFTLPPALTGWTNSTSASILDFHFLSHYSYIKSNHWTHLMASCRGGICPSRQSRRECKIFASGVNFSIFTHFLCFFLLKLLKLGEIDGVKFLA